MTKPNIEDPCAVKERKRLLIEFYGIPQSIKKQDLRDKIEKLLTDGQL